MQKLQIFVEGQSLDLFDFETIQLKRVIKDIQDPSKLFTDYSRSFEVPATKQNNKIFKHYYRSDVTNGIDARAMISAELRLNLVNFKKGNIEVKAANMRDGKPYSYEIVFYGKLTELTKKMGKEELSSLPLNSFNHLSTTTAVLDRLRDVDGSTYGNEVIYPLISRSKRFIYDTTSSTASVGLENTKNVAYSGATRTAGDYGIEKKDLIPALRFPNIISAMETRYGFTFEGAIKSNTFEDLYLALHRPAATEGSTVSKILTGVDELDDNQNGINYQAGGYLFISNYNAYGNYSEGNSKRFNVTVTTASTGYSLKMVSGALGTVASLNQDNNSFSYNAGGTFDTFHFVLEGDASDTFSINIDVIGTTTYQDYSYGTQTSSGTIGSATFTESMTEDFIVSENLPNMRVTDFLSGIFKKWNIIAEVDGNTIKTYFYDYYMSLGTAIEVSEYVETDSHRVERPNLYSSIHFGHEDAKTQIEDAYNKVNNRDYAELKYRLEDVKGNKLIGDEYKVKVPFSQIPLENLEGSYGGLTYASIGDKDGKEMKPKAYFFYSFAQDNKTLAFDTLSNIEQVLDYRVVSNVQRDQLDAPFGTGLYFGEEIDEHTLDGSFLGTGLFNSFHKNLIAQMFDESKRIVKLRAFFPIALLYTIGLNDRLIISGRQYLISSMNTNFQNMETRLELISVEESDLAGYKLNCRTYTNDSDTDVKSIMYLNAEGEIQYQDLNPTQSIDICMIGNPIAGTLLGVGEGSSDEGDETNDIGELLYSAALNVVNNVPDSYVTYQPSSMINNLTDGSSYAITATLNPNNGFEFSGSITPSTSYTFAGNIDNADANYGFSFNGATSVIDTPQNLGCVLSLVSGGTTPIVGTDVVFNVTLSGGVQPYNVVWEYSDDGGLTYTTEAGAIQQNHTWTVDVVVNRLWRVRGTDNASTLEISRPSFQ